MTIPEPGPIPVIEFRSIIQAAFYQSPTASVSHGHHPLVTSSKLDAREKEQLVGEFGLAPAAAPLPRIFYHDIEHMAATAPTCVSLTS